METLQTWWATELYPMRERDQFGVSGEFEVVLAADAQATIATLEQRVKELKQWVQDQSTANLETMRHMDEMQSRAMDAESQLTQRTAELEAVNRVLEEKADCADLWYDEFLRIRALNASQEINGICDRALDGIKRNVPMVQENQQLHVELERVRALIKALPKVEKCFVTGQTFVQYKVAKAIYCLSFPDTEAANGFLALLQHRQGMEG